MNFTSVSFIIDIIGSVLLAAVIFYTIRLNQHFQMLQKNRAELARQLSGFAHSTERAELAIQQVRQSTKDSAQQMEDLLQRAETLKTDLGFLVDRASGLADRLEGNVRRDQDNSRAGAAAPRSRRASRDSAAMAEPTVPKRSRNKPAEAAPAALASDDKLARPTRRRRRSSSEGEAEGKTAETNNSELLKVLQGMR